MADQMSTDAAFLFPRTACAAYDKQSLCCVSLSCSWAAVWSEAQSVWSQFPLQAESRNWPHVHWSWQAQAVNEILYIYSYLLYNWVASGIWRKFVHSLASFPINLFWGPPASRAVTSLLLWQMLSFPPVGFVFSLSPFAATVFKPDSPAFSLPPRSISRSGS